MDDLGRLYGDIVDEVPEKYHDDFKKGISNQRGPTPTVAAIKAYNEEFDFTIEEAAEDMDVSRTSVIRAGEDIGYRDDFFEEIEKHKAIVPEKFRNLVERHSNSNGKPRTITAAIYSLTQDVDLSEAAEAFNTTVKSTEKYVPRVQEYLDAEEITDGENLKEIYYSENPLEVALNLDSDTDRGNE